MTADPNEEGMSFEAAIAAVNAAKASKAPAPEVGTEATPEASPAEGASAESVSAPEGAAGGQEPKREEAPAPQAASAESKPPESAPVDPALKKLLDREAALQAREKELNKIEAAKRKFKYDPVAAIRDIAPDASLADIAKALWVEELGDLAPPEAKQAKEFRGVRSEVEELREQVQEERRRLAEEYERQQQEAAMNQYTGAIKTAIGSVEPGKYPLVNGFYKKHSDGVVDELLAIAKQHAQSAGEVLTPEQLVGKLETYLGRYQVGPEPAPAPPPVETKQQVPVTQTLRNSHTQVQPNLQPADDLDDDYLREQALKAVREDRKRRGLG